MNRFFEILHDNILLIVLSAIIVGIPSCIFITRTVDVRDEKSDIVAVWKHNPGEYSVTIKDGVQLIDKSFQCEYGCDIEVIADVPVDQNMWYEGHWDWDSFWGGGYRMLKIHVHSVDDINGGGWSRGKFGSGMTERVE